MPIITPGVFPNTAFPDRVWIDDVWAEYGATKLMVGVVAYSDPLSSDISYN